MDATTSLISKITVAITPPLQLVVLAMASICIWRLIRWLKPLRVESKQLRVAFFHPYCNAGGGGERVLWCALRALQRRYDHVQCYVYTGDRDATPRQILDKAEQRFGVRLPRPVEFVFLRSRILVEAKTYPFLTLAMQSLGSVIMASEALSKLRPDVYVDTMGYPFTYPLFRYVGGCRVCSYTHYPTVSNDMLERVAEGVEAHNNRGFIARNLLLRALKIRYYRAFAILYSLAGRCADLALVNSSWTLGHILALWGTSLGPTLHVVYPPCDIGRFGSLPVLPDSQKPTKRIVSVGQFRPEKDHSLQLRILHRLLQEMDPDAAGGVELVMVGGCRNQEDQERVQALKDMASDLGIGDRVVWKTNAPFEELLQCVRSGTAGLHTMRCEHFGISVVESMAGGLVMVAHDSGGPKTDILVEYGGRQTGYRATDVESYVRALKEVLESSDE